MKVLHERSDRITKGSVCAIGGFDGVHRGHQGIIQEVKKRAPEGKKTGIITFHPLPIFVLKAIEIFYITPEPEKESILRELGLDFVYYVDFTRDFAALGTDDFVDYLEKKVSPAVIVVGENFHFGHDRKGTARTLADLAHGRFAVDIVTKIKDEGTISSTRIRELLLLGDIRNATKLLGRNYALSGKVIRGKGKGTQIGFPTINLAVEKEKLLPLDGVYRVKVLFDRHEYLGGMFCRHGVVEVHMLNFTGDLYEKEVSVQVVERIRDIKEFADDNRLKKAISQDIQKVSRAQDDI